jgi:hypothetical protein
MNQKNLTNVDWSKIPKPEGEENLTHLNNYIIKPIKLKSTQNKLTELSEIKGLTIIYVYPMTGQPDKPLPDNWITYLERVDVHLNLAHLEIIFMN